MANKPGSNPKRKLTRRVIYPKDIAALTGKHIQTARRMLRLARLRLGKGPHAFITAKDISVVFGIEVELLDETGE